MTSLNLPGVSNSDRIPNVTVFGPPLFKHHLVGSESAVPNGPRQFTALNNDITPIFRFKNWRNLIWPHTKTNISLDASYDRNQTFDYPLAFYDRLKPALRLATVFLERARPFFVTIYRAPVLERNGKVYLDHTYRPNAFDYALFTQLETYLSETLIIYYNDNLTPDKTVVLGVTAPLENTDKNRPIDYMACMGVCKELIRSIGMSDFHTKPREMRETQLVYLAMLLVHELAHAVWFTRNFEDSIYYSTSLDWVSRTEPIIPPIEFSELGHTLACVLFGGDLCLTWTEDVFFPNLPSFDGKEGLRIDFFNKKDYTDIIAFKKVSEKTTHSFFNKLTWQNPNQPPDRPSRHLPVSIYCLPCDANETHQTVLHDPRQLPAGNNIGPSAANRTMSQTTTREDIMRNLGRGCCGNRH